MIFNTYKIQFLPTVKQAVFFALLFSLISCAGSKSENPVTINIPANAPPAPDYSTLNNWAAHPAKYDFSDSIPAPYGPVVTDTTADVFFLYPTSYLDAKAINEANLQDIAEQWRWNAPVTDDAVNRVTDKSSMLNQASVFNAYRVFAPRYRQAHIRTFYIADSMARPFFDTAYADVKNAFLYYLQFENNGRPFMIASHSQGTLHAARLIKEVIEEKPLQKQLIAAYLLGLPVKTDFFKQLNPCDKPDATGCIISWRTFKKGYVPPYVHKESFKAIVVNPLNWAMDDAWVSRKENLGTVLYAFNKPKIYNVGAGIHGNVLWSSKPRFFGNVFFTRKNYHIGDINLFWKNMRDNAAVRVQAFKNNQLSNNKL